MTALDHPVTWAAARPLWRGAGSPGKAPTLLRFSRDDFMEQLFAILENDPGELTSHVARHETWRTPAHETATADLVDRVPLPKTVKEGRLKSFFRKREAAIQQKRAALITQAAVAAVTVPPTLKLYQPAHQRYYIATATLACAKPGLPDRALGGGHEQVGFVLRRLMIADDEQVEYAFIKEQQGGSWRRVSSSQDDAILAPGEEMLPVFPLAHKDHSGLRRTMWGGLIPVARREEYLSAAIKEQPLSLFAGQKDAMKAKAVTAKTPSKMARMTQLKMEVIEPWKALTASVLKAAAEIEDDTDSKNNPAKKNERVRALNYQYQTQSWLLLYDLSLFLKAHLPDVLEVIKGTAQRGILSPAKDDVLDWMNRQVSEIQLLKNGFLTQFDDPGTADIDESRPSTIRPTLPSLAAALKEISKAGIGANLEAMVTSYQGVDATAPTPNWPPFHFLMAGLGMSGKTGGGDAASSLNVSAQGLFKIAPSAPTLSEEEEALFETKSRPNIPVPNAPNPYVTALDNITALIIRAIDAEANENAPPLPFAQQLSQTMSQKPEDSGLFVLRFVHVNADCGPLHPPTLSTASEKFQLASFFDSDAPARPIRITLPMDTSPAGLRKHAKGTAFVMSDMLCGQVQRAKGLGLVDLVRHVLPWPLHKELNVGDGGGCKNGTGVDIGMICSLSIPIITICALILLIIIVTLLDFIFRWIPWFIMCFPVPKLKGKPPL